LPNGYNSSLEFPKKDTELLTQQIIGFSKQKLAKFKLPRSIDFVDALPRHETGKLLVRLLKEPYWSKC
jgi:long-chain acyl-CoA synthetase